MVHPVNKWRRSFFPAVALTALATMILSAGGCQKGNFSAAEKNASANVLRVAIATAPTSLDPAKVQDVDTGDLMQNIFEGLVSYSEENKIQPQLAESWTTKNGEKTYVFKLRADAKFHDGTLVTAKDVKASLERAANPSLGSATAGSYLTDIVGFDEVAAGKATVFSGVRAVDDTTLEIDIKSPIPFFLGKLTYPCAYVLPAKTAASEITDPKACIGTGPFRLESYDPDQQVNLAAFKEYYGGAPVVEKFVRPVIKDASTRLNKYRGGELDLLTIERQDLDAVNADPKLKSERRDVPRPAIYYVGLNQGKYPPFKDVRVRRAFAMAIDRARIASDRIKLPEAKGFLPPGIGGYRADLKGIPYDPIAARSLLEAAGYKDGKGLPPLKIYYRDGRPDSQLLAVSVVSDLKKNLGIEVQPQSMEWRTFLEARNRKELGFVGLSWYADYLDPQNFLSFLMRSDATENRDGYASKAFDDLCAKADVEPDETTRMALYQQAEDLLLTDVARIPCYFGKDDILISTRLSGVRTNLFGLMPMSKVKITP